MTLVLATIFRPYYNCDMETIISICIALLAPLPAIRKVPADMCPALWYLAGTLFVGWGLHVVIPVSILLGFYFLCCLLADTKSCRAATKNPQP